MTLVLDTRAPIFVLVSQFNPAIFQPAWVARYLFDKGDGDDVTVMEMIARNGANVIKLHFFEGVALGVAEGRTEVFVLDSEPETLNRAETILLKMIAVLPHTPVTAVGCNFSYFDEDPSDGIVSLFDTPEGFEGEGALNLRQFGVQLQMDNLEVLNFNRNLTDQGVQFTFNYHIPESDSAQYSGFIPGFTARALIHSKKILKSYFNYDNHESVSFASSLQQGGGGNVAEN